MSKEEGIVVMPTTIPDPPEAGGVEAAPRTGKGNPLQKIGIVARKATRRESVGRSAPILRNPDVDEPNKEIGNDRTTQEKLGKGPAFVMRHEANSMKKNTPKSNEVW